MEYNKAKKMLNSLLQQKAEISWLKCGDKNSKVSYQAFRDRRRQNKAHAIKDNDGIWVNQREKVDDAFVRFYKQLFSCFE